MTTIDVSLYILTNATALRSILNSTGGNDCCGIKWDPPKKNWASVGSQQIVYQGKVGNCQACMLMKVI